MPVKFCRPWDPAFRPLTLVVGVPSPNMVGSPSAKFQPNGGSNFFLLLTQAGALTFAQNEELKRIMPAASEEMNAFAVLTLNLNVSSVPDDPKELILSALNAGSISPTQLATTLTFYNEVRRNNCIGLCFS